MQECIIEEPSKFKDKFQESKAVNPADGLMCMQSLEDHGFLFTRPPTLTSAAPPISAVSCKDRTEEGGDGGERTLASTERHPSTSNPAGEAREPHSVACVARGAALFPCAESVQKLSSPGAMGEGT